MDERKEAKKEGGMGEREQCLIPKRLK